MKSIHPEKDPASKRLLSLDALRGFDMFWIVGGGLLLRSLGSTTDWPWADALARQMHHAHWNGFFFWDLIFPLFMFLAGVSIPFAILGKLGKGGSRSKLIWRIVRRLAVLIIFGMIYNGVFRNFENPRYASVLGQIGVGYIVAVLVVLFFKKAKPALFAFLLISLIVTAAQLWIPVPEHGAGVLTPEGSMNAFLDQRLLPGKLYRDHYDPQGILCMISGAGVTLLGVLSGFLLRKDNLSGYRKSGIMAGAGTGLIIAALIINPWYPINKEIWTTTFNLLTGGISLLLFAVFYLLIDVLHITRWSFPFRIIGLNAITIYMGARLFNFKHTSEFLFGGIGSLCGDFKPAVIMLGVIIIEWLLLYLLYRKKIFLKV